ncbi:MAG: hypothetical protein IJ752_05215 [Alphaproteobacteria bacterium]|nr:hypothetical protein [Alphaproteobacteria bacterium]
MPVALPPYGRQFFISCQLARPNLPLEGRYARSAATTEKRKIKAPLLNKRDARGLFNLIE